MASSRNGTGNKSQMITIMLPRNNVGCNALFNPEVTAVIIDPERHAELVAQSHRAQAAKFLMLPLPPPSL